MEVVSHRACGLDTLILEQVTPFANYCDLVGLFTTIIMTSDATSHITTDLFRFEDLKANNYSHADTKEWNRRNINVKSKLSQHGLASSD